MATRPLQTRLRVRGAERLGEPGPPRARGLRLRGRPPAAARDPGPGAERLGTGRRWGERGAWPAKEKEDEREGKTGPRSRSFFSDLELSCRLFDFHIGGVSKVGGH